MLMVFLGVEDDSGPTVKLQDLWLMSLLGREMRLDIYNDSIYATVII